MNQSSGDTVYNYCTITDCSYLTDMRGVMFRAITITLDG